ncbi:DUF4197 family protein [Halpernia frigidisoli]|uniref:DUF4197 family protein n=1 Tax=Halpernia frigidisoli TaxID=1125876 RepID=A0A1I3E8X9_9FLAO|nr:DUF4197 family protein [Halpernia frigidisoli]SFH95415.1 Protein of unknown function [Halpernia frigidisoli]
MKTNFYVIAAVSAVTVTATTTSCVALATSGIGLAILKKVLLGGINKGLNIFSDKNSFLQNNLIDQAMPSQLRQINSTLESLGLKNLVAKEKDYIAQAAVYTVGVSRPILTNAVNNLTSADAVRIAQGGSGIATQILREKTESQLVAALTPKVNEKLNEFGIVKTINSALSGSNLLGSLLGQNNTQNIATNGLSNFATQQLVNGLFNIIQKDEVDNTSMIKNSLNQNTK